MILSIGWAYAALGVGLGLIIIYAKFLRNDTSPTSRFFTIDTSRTLRFVYSYCILLGFAYSGLLFAVPFIFGFIALVLAFAFFIVINLIALIIGLISLIFGGSMSFLQIDDLVVLFDNGFMDFMFGDYWDLVFLILIPTTIVLISPLIGFLVTRYVEDTKSSIIGIIFFILFYEAALLVFYEGLVGIYTVELYYTVMIVVFPLLGFIGARYLFPRSDEYNLIEVNKLLLSSILVLSLVTEITMILYLGIYIGQTFEFSTNLFTIISIIVYLIMISSLVIIVKAFIEGDHGYEFRLSMIEVREELLEEAREFKELHEGNIEDFASKSTSMRL